MGLMALLQSPAPAVVCLLIGLYLLFAIRMADQWEKVAVLRLGKYIGLRGPGMFTIIPVVDTLSRYVDQRVRVANVSAESTLTRDTVRPRSRRSTHLSIRTGASPPTRVSPPISRSTRRSRRSPRKEVSPRAA